MDRTAKEFKVTGYAVRKFQVLKKSERIYIGLAVKEVGHSILDEIKQTVSNFFDLMNLQHVSWHEGFCTSLNINGKRIHMQAETVNFVHSR